LGRPDRPALRQAIDQLLLRLLHPDVQAPSQRRAVRAPLRTGAVWTAWRWGRMQSAAPPGSQARPDAPPV